MSMISDAAYHDFIRAKYFGHRRSKGDSFTHSISLAYHLEAATIDKGVDAVGLSKGFADWQKLKSAFGDGTIFNMFLAFLNTEAGKILEAQLLDWVDKLLGV